MALLLVCVLSLHALTAHGFADSLVYCFESDGEVNIESTTDFSLGFTKKSDVHSDSSHAHDNNDAIIHASNEGHKDLDVTVICSKDNNANRYSQDKVVQSLLAGSHSAFEYLPLENTTQRVSSQTPYFEDDNTKALQTIILLI
jgi:hypothetical protein|tara:strand:- start:89493 stop:89921 length:429 start_codon:yes stop_codon:yes gene_type:complete